MGTSLSLKQRLALELQRQLNKDSVTDHVLAQLFWECTLRCNLKCRHCGSDCKVSALHEDMPFEDFKKVLEDIAAHYDPRKITIVVTGGEPLMRRDLEACGREITRLGFPWGMVTNGRAMTKQRLDSLLASGLRAATVSLDGPEEAHNWMRGPNDSFKYASEAVKMFTKLKNFPFDVVTCVNSKNVDQLEEFKEYLISCGLKEWRLFTIFPVGRAAEDKELQLSPEQFRSLLDFIIRTRKEGRIKASFACEGFLGEYEGRVRDNMYVCHAGISIASVLIDGSISACASIRSNYIQGNIYKDSFSDVWENRFAQYRDRSWMHKDKCGSCKFFRYCLGNGMHLRDNDGNLLLCHVEKIEG